MNEYLKKLKLEYMNETGLKNDNGFEEWLQKYRIKLFYYLEFLKQNGFDLNDSVVELNKGKYDTLGIVLPLQERLVEVSPWALSIENNKVFKCSGSLIVKENKPVILNGSQESCIEISDNSDYLIDLSMYYPEKTKIEDLVKLNSNIYFGTYGFTNALNKQAKLNELLKYRDMLRQMKLDVIENSMVIYDTYAYLLKVKKK